MFFFFFCVCVEVKDNTVGQKPKKLLKEQRENTRVKHAPRMREWERTLLLPLCLRDLALPFD